mmetsp:Transcript_68092/g.190147  ORF Transcript_68092/g.190147 Transcript_68092/m.190147 type:complete len:385 (-) Transcript_68092:870-2024(-)
MELEAQAKERPIFEHEVREKRVPFPVHVAHVVHRENVEILFVQCCLEFFHRVFFLVRLGLWRRLLFVLFLLLRGAWRLWWRCAGRLGHGHGILGQLSRGPFRGVLQFHVLLVPRQKVLLPFLPSQLEPLAWLQVLDPCRHLALENPPLQILLAILWRVPLVDDLVESLAIVRERKLREVVAHLVCGHVGRLMGPNAPATRSFLLLGKFGLGGLRFLWFLGFLGFRHVVLWQVGVVNHLLLHLLGRLFLRFLLRLFLRLLLHLLLRLLTCLVFLLCIRCLFLLRRIGLWSVGLTALRCVVQLLLRLGLRFRALPRLLFFHQLPFLRRQRYLGFLPPALKARGLALGLPLQAFLPQLRRGSVDFLLPLTENKLVAFHQELIIGLAD